jgi:excisionase family DNA binding protein
MCPTCGCPQTKWLHVRTVARQFRCTTRTVLRMIERGEIDATRFGRCWRIDHDSLDHYVQHGAARASRHARHQALHRL